jgi:hypothetical protein
MMKYILFYNVRALTTDRNRIKAVKTEIVNGINELINAKSQNNKHRTIMRYALFE